MNVEMMHKTEDRGGARGAPINYTVHTRSKLFYRVNIEFPSLFVCLIFIF